jgi:hypothetical protein
LPLAHAELVQVVCQLIGQFIELPVRKCVSAGPDSLCVAAFGSLSGEYVMDAVRYRGRIRLDHPLTNSAQDRGCQQDRSNRRAARGMCAGRRRRWRTECKHSPLACVMGPDTLALVLAVMSVF